MKAPDQLRIENGIIRRVESNNPPDDYLREWQRVNGVPNGEAVCLVRRSDLQRLYDGYGMNTSA
jgi:hypothetical protein